MLSWFLHGEETKERPTLVDIFKVVIFKLDKAFGVDVYELTSEMFLFESPNRFMTEQTR